MNGLERALFVAIGTDTNKDTDQYPADVAAFRMPRGQFREAAKAMKMARARLVAEWASDETLYTCPPLPREWEGKRNGAGVLGSMPAMKKIQNI